MAVERGNGSDVFCSFGKRDGRCVSKLLVSVFLIAGLFGIARTASAQFPFQLVVQSGASTTVVGNGADINVAANGVGQSQQVIITITYTGTGSASLDPAQIFGSPAFSPGPAGAGVLTPGQSTAYTVSYTPTSGAQASASLSIAYSQTIGNSITNGSVSLSLSGTSPSFVLGYAVQPQGNAVALSNGGTLMFPPTVVGTSITAVLAIENTGSAPGKLNAFALSESGTAFQATGLPLLPGTIAGGQTLQISVVYTPSAVAADSGTIQLTFPGQTVTITLAGTGISSQLTFTVVQGTQTLVVNQNQVSLSDTPVGGSTTVSVNALNSGSANLVVNSISLTGPGFLLVNGPPLPLTLAQGGSFNLTFTFTPPQAGNFTASLLIGGVTFSIAARGLGPLYQYSYTTGSSTSPVSPNGSLFFATAPLGQSSSTTFTVTNTGTAPGTVSGIFIGEANSPFAITGLPQVPLTIAPNQTVTFGITFTPATTASVSGTLHLDGTEFFLTGVGGGPPPLPSYSFSGPQGTLGPLQQPAVGLSLAAPYPLAITGTLTLTAIPDGFTADPAIQFSTGGKTVAFSIPANTTAAVFANGSDSIRLQTGSTSGTITLTPAFQTASGVPLTPATVQSLQLVVPATAVQLIGVQAAAASPTQLTLAISGVSNSQSLTKIDLIFTAASGFRVTGGTVSIPLAIEAAAWFESAAAQAFGGQFVVTIPFTFSGLSSNSTTAATSAVTGVSITATDAQGTSAPVMLSLP